MNSNKILIVAQNWLGDALFSTPAIRAIRKTYPQAHLAVLTPERAAGVFRRNPHVDEVIVYNERDSFFSPSFWRTSVRLKQRRFDLAIFFHRSKTKVWLTKLARIRERWGYSNPGRNKLLTRAIEPPKGRHHRIDYFLHLVEKLGIKPDGRLMEFIPGSTAAAELDKIFTENQLQRSQPYIVVHVGGNWQAKRWPLEYFAQWIFFIQEQYAYPVIVCGTSSEENLAKKVLKRFQGQSVYSFCGKTSLDALALLLKEAKLLLSNDSGPIHLAASQKTSIIGLYGPTLPEETGPVSAGPVEIMRLDTGCEVPCYFKHCNYRICLDWLLPAQVFKKAQEVLAKQ